MQTKPLKQPHSLPLLFFSEFSQRFSYWGIQSLLALFLINNYLLSHKEAYDIYGAFTALTFLLSILGGFIADRYFGFKPSLILGIIFSAIGNLFLTIPYAQHSPFIFIGLALICYGTGIFLPSNSNMLGTFYDKNDTRRDRGFTILYVGTNTGGLLGPIIYGFIYQTVNWHIAFLTSFIILVLWLITYLKLNKYLDAKYQKQSQKNTFSFYYKNTIYFTLSIIALLIIFILLKHTKFVGYLLDTIGLITLFVFLGYAASKKEGRKNILLLILMIAITLLFFTCELQTNSSLIIFTQDYIKRDYLNITIPASAFASLEPGFVIISSLALLKVWKKLQNKEPSELTKLIIGLFLAAGAFAILTLTAKVIMISNHTASIGWIIAAYLLLGAGESCIMPPLLAAITHRAPSNARGTFMGGLYLALAFSGYLAGKIAKLTSCTFHQGHVNLSHIGYEAAAFLAVFQHIYYLILGTASILALANFGCYVYRKIL